MTDQIEQCSKCTHVASGSLCKILTMSVKSTTGLIDRRHRPVWLSAVM